MKTKKIVVKRFKITKNKKVLHRTQGMRHIRRKKSKSRQRRMDMHHELKNRKQIKIVKTLLQSK